MRAAVFVRYHSGDGFGHVGWAFDASPGLADAGSVENHSGHLFTPASRMGFWNGIFRDPVAEMRARGYDDLKWIEVPHANPQLARRTVLWIKDEAYKALHRNCEDDVYDILRAYGVENLAFPSIVWFPKSWFGRFQGTLAHASEYEWPLSGDAHAPAGVEGNGDAERPWQPTWRRPWHAHFHQMKLQRLRLLLPL